MKAHLLNSVVLNSQEGALKPNSININGTRLITSVTTTSELTGSENALVTEKAIVDYVAEQLGGTPEPCLLDDEFTGTDGTPASAARWIDPSASAYRINGNALRMDPTLYPANPVILAHQQEFTGDYDIMVSHPIAVGLDVNVTSNVGFCVSSINTLDLLTPNKGGIMYAQYIGDGAAKCWTVNFFWTDGTIASEWDLIHLGSNNDCYEYTQGEIMDFRLERVGSTLTSYVRMPDSETWLTVGTVTSTHVLSMNYVGFNTVAYADNSLGFDSFMVLSGCPEPSVLVDNKYIHAQSSDSTSWTVTHSLGEKYVLVQAYDQNDVLIAPSSITLNSTDALTLTFSTEKRGTAVIVG